MVSMLEQYDEIDAQRSRMGGLVVAVLIDAAMLAGLLAWAVL